MTNPQITTPAELSSKVQIKLQDPHGNGIEGLKYQILEGSKIVAKGVTGSKGDIVPFMSKIGCLLTVHVKRFGSEEMKQIKTVIPWSEDFRIKVLSGKRKEKLPLAPSNGSPGDYKRKTYPVARDDTLGKIAKRYGTSAEALAALNGIDVNAIIHIDQILKVPLEKGDAAPDSPDPAGVEKATPAEIQAPAADVPAPVDAPPAATDADTPGPVDAPPAPAAAGADAPELVNATPPPADAGAPAPVVAPPAPAAPPVAKPAVAQEVPKSKNVPVTGPVPTSKAADRGENGTPKTTINQQCDQTACLKLGDTGAFIEELNIRLMGFGGTISAPKGLNEYTAQTVLAVKQFQRDYMGVAETGKVCGAVLRAMDEFRASYPIALNIMLCSCGKCNGFGNGYTDSSIANVYDKKKNIVKGIEYPGVHRGLIWIFRAALFYTSKKDKNLEYSFLMISSGYRCWHDNKKQKNRTSTNHMGNALDLQFRKGNAKTRCEGEDVDNLRRDIFVKRLNAQMNWDKKNMPGLEPAKFRNGDVGAPKWVHIDVREFDAQYKIERFYATTQSGADGDSGMVEFAKKKNLLKLANCGGVPPKTAPVATDRLPIASISLSPAGLEFIKDWEKFRPDAYNDAKEYCTIGYGHLIAYKTCEALAKEANPEYQIFKKNITEEAALAILSKDVVIAVKTATKFLQVPLYQQEYDALISLAFNAGGLRKFPKLVSKLNTGDYKGCCDEFKDITNGGIDGLVKRRNAEMNMFRNNVYDSSH